MHRIKGTSADDQGRIANAQHITLSIIFTRTKVANICAKGVKKYTFFVNPKFSQDLDEMKTVRRDQSSARWGSRGFPAPAPERPGS